MRNSLYCYDARTSSLYGIADIVSKRLFIAYESAIIFVYSPKSIINSYGKTFSGVLDIVESQNCVFFD